MLLLVEKLGRSLKFPSKPVDRHLKSDALSESLADFRSKISEFIAGILLPESELLSLKGFNKCFELIHTSNRALAELAIAIDYPMNQWGANLSDEYLSCTSDLLSLSNAVTSSVSHLTHAKMRLLHAVDISHGLAAAPQKLKFERPIIRLGERACSRQERVLLQALIFGRKLALLALGLVVSGLCGDVEPYLAVRRNAGELEEDPLVKDVDSRFYRELVGVGVMEEVREVNAAVGAQSVEEVKRRLKVMEDSLQGIEKQSDHLFSQLLTARNKLLANIRFPE